MDLFENAVFMLSCRRVKTELFENADVTASIYDVSEHAHGSLGITQGHFDCLFSFVKVHFHSFIFTYLGTVAPSVRGNCFSGGRGNTFTNRKIDTTK